MGLFGPFVYKAKSGQKYYLHMKMKGKVRLYYFSKDPTGALFSVPTGYEVVENPKTGLPFLRKKIGGGIFSIFKPKHKKSAAEGTEK